MTLLLTYYDCTYTSAHCGPATYQGALLQTKKPFLTSCIAVPALPALLLCAHRVDAAGYT